MSEVFQYEQDEEIPIGDLPFEERKSRLLAMIDADPVVRDTMIVEMYIAITDMERHMRSVMMNGGPFKMLARMMGKGGNPDE